MTIYKAIWVMCSCCLFFPAAGISEAMDNKQPPQCRQSDPNKPIEVLYFQPDGIQNTFWSATQSFAKDVAQDLNINLRVVGIDSVHRNRIAFEELVKETLDSGIAPDMIMSVMYGGGEFTQLQQFEGFGIPYFTVNTSLDDKVLKLTGRPRQQFKHWIGHMSPNEIKAGRQLVSDLINANLSGNHTMGILGGAPLSIISTHRVAGALQVAREQRVNVIPPINTDWTEISSMKAARTLLHRVSQFDMLWTAGPDIAKGAIQVLKDSNRQAVVGSFDWSLSNAQLIKQGSLQVSYGGHFMQPGWSLVLIKDYLSGLDFYSELGGLMLTDLQRLDRSNVDEILPGIIDQQWQKIDFKQYTKCSNPSLKSYNFKLVR